MARTTIPPELVAVNAIQGTLIADNSVTAVHIATNAISGTLVADNSITSTHIAQNQVTATHIAQNTITVTQMADSAIETAKINADAITGAKIADNAIDSEHYTDGSIDTAHIADLQVTAAKIGANAVTLAKMASLTRGSILIGNSAADVSALAIGSNGYVLTSDGTDAAWAAASGGLATSGGTLTGNLTMGGMILKPSGDGGSIGFNRNPDNGNHVGDSGLRRFQINGPDSTGGDFLQIQSYNSSGTHQGNLNIQDGNLTFGDDKKVKFGNSTGDLELYHIGGSVSVLRSTPALVIQSDSYISLGTYSDGELMLKATKNGAVDIYHDNVIQASTTSTGLSLPTTPVFDAGRNAGYQADDNNFIQDYARTNVGSHYSTSTGRFTAPRAGQYLVMFRMFTHDSGGVVQAEVTLKKNGGNHMIYRAHKVGGYHTPVQGTKVITLAANDYIQTYVGDSGTSSGWMGSAHEYNYFCAFLIG